MKFGRPVKQSQTFNRDNFHDIFWKKDVVALT